MNNSNVFRKARVILKSNAELSANGTKYLSEQCRILGDAVLRVFFSRMQIKVEPLVRSENMTNFLSKALSSDSIASFCSDMNLDTVANMEEASNKLKCELFEAYVGYVVLSKGITDGLTYLMPLLDTCFTQSYSDFNRIEKFDKFM